MTNLIPTPNVFLVNDKPATTSLAIAEHFSKRHDHVMRDIRKLYADLPDEVRAPNFEETFRTVAGPNNSERQETFFTVYFDGFILLVMSYTGKKALQIKLAYIAAFNAMRERLAAQPLQNMQPLPDTPITPDQQCTLQAMVKALVERGGHYANIWSRFNNHFRIARYCQLPQSRMSEAVDYLMRLPVEPKKLPPSPTVAKNATVGIAGGELVPDNTPEVLTVFNDRDVFQRVRASVEEARRGMDKAFRELDELSLFMQRKHMTGYDPAKLRKGGAIAQMNYAFKEHWNTAICSLNASVHTVRAMQAVDEL